jgi:hypothetical protein
MGAKPARQPHGTRRLGAFSVTKQNGSLRPFLDEQSKSFSKLTWRPRCLSPIVIGFRKWALVAYVVLAIYLLTNPASDKLVERSQTFDEHLGAQPTSALSPALAAALGVPEQSVACYLQNAKAKPSELVFNKLLDRCGSARGNADLPTALVDSGVSVKEALAYFDTVEKTVMTQLTVAQAHTCEPGCSKPVLRAQR